MIDVFSPILIQLGFGGIGGFFVGYLLKKVLKFALMIGVIAFIFTYFAYESYMEIDYAQLIETGMKTVEIMPSGATVAQLAAKRLGRGDSDDALSLTPLYLKESTARAFLSRYTGTVKTGG